MKSRKQVLKKRFLSTLYLSAFTFGGGYVIVTQHSWLSLQEFADLVAIAEMTPGPIAINAATFVWTRLAGVPGALTATPSGRGHDRLGRRPDSDERSLGWRGSDLSAAYGTSTIGLLRSPDLKIMRWTLAFLASHFAT